MAQTFEHSSAVPRLRFEAVKENGQWFATKATNLDTGETFLGAEAAILWEAKRTRDLIAVAAIEAVRTVMPEVDELRADIGETVVFGLPSDQADEFGQDVADAIVAALPEAVQEGRLAAVWA